MDILLIKQLVFLVLQQLNNVPLLVLHLVTLLLIIHVLLVQKELVLVMVTQQLIQVVLVDIH